MPAQASALSSHQGSEKLGLSKSDVVFGAYARAGFVGASCRCKELTHVDVSAKFLFLQQKQWHTKKAADRPSPSPMPPSAASWAAPRGRRARLSRRPLLSHRPRAAPGSTCTSRSRTPCELSVAFGAESWSLPLSCASSWGLPPAQPLAGPSQRQEGREARSNVAVKIGNSGFYHRRRPEASCPSCSFQLLIPGVPSLVLSGFFLFNNKFLSRTSEIPTDGVSL